MQQPSFNRNTIDGAIRNDQLSLALFKIQWQHWKR